MKEDAMLAAMLVAIIVVMTGCSGVAAWRTFDDEGYAIYGGSETGIQAMNDGSVGLVEQGRADPGMKTGYWQNREKETTVKGLRFQAKKRGQ